MINRIKHKIVNKELLVFLLIIIYSLAIRLYKLSSVPSVINGDEVGSIIHPLQIIFNKYETIYSKSSGIFTLTHDHSVSYIIYIFKALSIYLLGIQNSLFAARLITALESVLVLIPFYLILRKVVNKYTSLLTTFAFASNYWFLNFSRRSWINIDCLLPGLLLLLFTRKTVDKNELKYYIFTSILSAIVLYNYIGGRVYFLASLVILFTNLFKKEKKRVNIRKIKYFFLYITLTFIFFLPQTIVILKNPSLYLLRPSSLNVFKESNPYYGISPENKLGIIKHQISYAFRGFVLMDKRVAAEGFENLRYLPNSSSEVNILITLLFWGGLIISIIRKRVDYMWFLVYIFNFLLLQIPSVYIPNWSRGIGILPIIYLFSALFLQEITTYLATSFPKIKDFILIMIAFVIIFFSLNDVQRYWVWVNNPLLQIPQQPAINISQINRWLPAQIYRIITDQRLIYNHEWINN